MRRHRLKQVAVIRYGLGEPPPSSPDGVPILRATNIERGRITGRDMIFARLEDLPLTRAPLLKAGEILVVRSGAYTGDSALITQEWAGCAPGYDLRVTPRSIESRFLAYQLLAPYSLDQIWLARTRAAQPHLNAEDLGDVLVWASTHEHESAIADYLDAETARIDHVAAAIERSLSLLAERRTSVLLSAFEQTQRSAARARVLALAEVVLGRQRSPEQAEGPYMTRYLRAANVKDGRLDLSDVMEMNFTPVEQQRFALRPGDVLISEGAGSLAAVGAAAVWKGELEGTVCIQNTLVRLRPRKGMDPSYVAWWARFAYESGLFASVAGGANIYHLGAETVGRLVCSVPTLVRQCEIARRLDNNIAALEREMDLRRQQVQFLQERRQALITAAVTGQIEIPGVAA
jgi:type I restriction enzyme, S subunit